MAVRTANLVASFGRYASRKRESSGLIALWRSRERFLEQELRIRYAFTVGGRALNDGVLDTPVKLFLPGIKRDWKKKRKGLVVTKGIWDSCLRYSVTLPKRSL